MKFASRYLLPCEILLALMMTSWGLSGWVGTGTLWTALSKIGLTHEWGMVMCSVGGFKLLVSGAEFGFGRGWSDRILFWSVSLRCVSAFLCLCVWFYVCYMFLVLPLWTVTMAMMIQAPVSVIFNAWIYCGNLKVRYLLNKDVPTFNLQNTIIMERSRLHRF